VPNEPFAEDALGLIECDEVEVFVRDILGFDRVEKFFDPVIGWDCNLPVGCEDFGVFEKFEGMPSRMACKNTGAAQDHRIPTRS